jgi:hypothetical protein
MSEAQYGLPMLIGSLSDTVAQGLRRVRLERGDGERFSERWLQLLVSRYPNLLPIDQIEPALTPAISICLELPLPSGFVDNLYVTPTGDLVIGETKLFRNPEARREVIGQISAAALSLVLLA